MCSRAVMKHAVPRADKQITLSLSLSDQGVTAALPRAKEAPVTQPKTSLLIKAGMRRR